MKTVEDLINKFGNKKALAEQIGIVPSNIIFWIKRGAIPVKYWPRLIDLCHERSIEMNAEILMRINLSKPKDGDAI